MSSAVALTPIERQYLAEILATEGQCNYRYRASILTRLQNEVGPTPLPEARPLDVNSLNVSEITAHCTQLGLKAEKLDLIDAREIPWAWTRPRNERFLAYEGNAGNWGWSVETDPFDKNITAVALTENAQGVQLGFSCIHQPRVLSVVLVLPDYYDEPGKEIAIAVDGVPAGYFQFSEVVMPSDTTWGVVLTDLEQAFALMAKAAHGLQQLSLRLSSGDIVNFDAAHSTQALSHVMSSCARLPLPNETAGAVEPLAPPPIETGNFENEECRFILARLERQDRSRTAPIAVGMATRSVEQLAFSGTWATMAETELSELSAELRRRNHEWIAQVRIYPLFPRHQGERPSVLKTLRIPMPGSQASLNATSVEFDIDDFWRGRLSFTECRAH